MGDDAGTAGTTRVRARVALSMFVASIIGTLVALGFQLTTESRSPSLDEWGLPGFEGILAVSCALIGLLIARRTSNPTGWIFTGLGVSSAFQYLAEEYSHAGLDPASTLPRVTTAAWVAEWIWVPLVASVGLLLLLFPDDRIGSRPGRAIARLGGLAAAGTLFSAAFLSPVVETWGVPNPYSINNDQAVADITFIVSTLLLMLAIVAAAVRLVARLRRATGVRRQQLKWFAYAALFASISLVFSAIPATTAVGSKFAVFGIVGIAVASAVAVLRYRLYDIDLVINRTLVYTALTAVLAALYAVLVFAFQALLSPFTSESDLAIAASTLAVAGLFRPARTRVQAFIDQRFYRRKFDAERTVADFSERLRNEVELGAVTSQLIAAASDTMQPAHVSVWLKPKRSLT